MNEGQVVRIKATGELAEVITATGDALKVARIMDDELDSVAIDLDVSAVEEPVHYTITRGGDTYLAGRERVYVVGHSLGAGYVRHIVELKDGDTADNPASTKGPIYGPCVVVYDVARTGIRAAMYDDAGGFYDALAEARATFGVASDRGLMAEAG